jgi:hypothetical protein
MNGESPAAGTFWRAVDGWRFFLLWMAGALVAAVASRLAPELPTPAATFEEVIWRMMPVGIAMSAWQGWMLFRLTWRAAVWASLPLGIYLPAPALLTSSQGWVQLQMIVAVMLLAQTMLLLGRRQRIWVYLLAGIVHLILDSTTTFIVNSSGLQALTTALGASVPWMVPVLGNVDAASGICLLGEAGGATALAWWMPPTTPGSRSESPLPPGSMAG